MRSIRPTTLKAQISRQLKSNIRYARLIDPIFPRQCSSCTQPTLHPSGRQSSPQAPTSPKVRLVKTPEEPPADHREVAKAFDLFITHAYSPGSPLFLPNGAAIFQKLQDFLRAQYPHFGFQEVVTPTIYKKSLWKVSGHWDNYADDMFSVQGRGFSGETEGKEIGENEEFGLKPMNCPGHCLLFASKVRSYRDLPIRYADFSALHRNEISGALTGLTRVRRFHQDDAHIFCRPSQIMTEIQGTLEFVSMVYQTFGLGTYKLLLSTRPTDHFIGSISDWDRAEAQLTTALDTSGLDWSLSPGDGAFYGPKIDIILKDTNGKEHQTATIQLDFQLPQRFELKYQASPDEPLSSSFEEVPDQPGYRRPVIIHRAIYGSLERFLALLLEHYNGAFPFWISPRQAIILSLNDTPKLLEHVDGLSRQISGQKEISTASTTREKARPVQLGQSYFRVDTDTRAVPLGQKVTEARKAGYNLVMVVGEKEVERGNATVQVGSFPAATKGRVKEVLKGFVGEGEKELVERSKGVGVNGERLRQFFKTLEDAYL